jgi:tyrosyl-tRNA synthetase
MEKGDGVSFAEFSYPLLQGWDWWHLYRSRGISMQIGGSDQFGNLISGIDAVTHLQKVNMQPPVPEGYASRKPVAITVPLLTTSSGEKFGKSAGNAIWLDAEMTSPLELYQVCISSLVLT